MRRNRLLPLAAAVALAACTPARDVPQEPDAWRQAQPGKVPWSISAPSDWHVETRIFAPGPRSIVGVARTAVASVRYVPSRRAPRPNSRRGATAELGPDGAVVYLLRLWHPAGRLWDPRPDGEERRVGPSRWHDDAQNPGWVFRERKVCLSSECVSVIEWHGPQATSAHVSYLERISSSLELQGAEIRERPLERRNG